MNRAHRRIILFIELSSLLSCSLLSARFVNGLLEAALLRQPPPPRGDGPRTRTLAGASPTISPGALARLFGQPLVPPSEQVASPSRATPLDRRLVGTLVANRSEWSMALVRDPPSGATRVLMEGDDLEGRRIARIERLQVMLDSGESLPLEGESAVASAPAPQASQASRPPGGSGVRRVGGESFEVARQWVDEVLGDPMRHSSGARIVPAFEGGRAVGFKFLSVRAGSLFAEIGLRSGDVVQRLNGLEINSPEKALEAYAALRSANRLVVELTREGRAVRQQYQVTP